jgi:hypothetical protein
MLSDRVRVLLLSLLLCLLAACGGGGGDPGTPGNQLPPTPTPPPAVTGGTLALVVGGLPSGTLAVVRLTGPNNFSLDVPESQTVVNLPPGIYTVTAFGLSSSGTTYNPSPTTQTVTVTSNETARAVVSYTSGPFTMALAPPEGQRKVVGFATRQG